MTLSLSIIFVLTSYVVLLYLPASHEYNRQLYRQSTLGNELTATEFEYYRRTGIVPDRLAYSHKKNAYVLKRPKVRKSSNENPQKAIPRWMYLLGMVNPFSQLGGFGGQTEEPFDIGDFEETDGEGDDGDNDGKDDDKKDDKNDDTEDDKNDDKKDDKPKDKKNDKNDEKNDKNDGGGYTQMAKDVLNSEITQDAIKTGVSFVPGGPAFLAALKAGSKIADAAGVKDKFAKKLKV